MFVILSAITMVYTGSPPLAAAAVIAALSGATLLATVIQRPEIAFYSFLLLYPFSDYALRTGVVTISVSNLLITTVCGAFAIRWLLRPQTHPRLGKHAKISLALLCWILLSVVLSSVNSDYPALGARFFVTRIGSAFAFIATILVIDRVKRLKVALLFYLGGLLFVSVFTVLHGLGYNPLPAQLGRVGSWWGTGGIRVATVRAVAFFTVFGSYGTSVLFLLPLVLLSIWRPNVLLSNRVMAASAAGLLLTAAFFTQARALWVGCAVALALTLMSWLYLGTRRYRSITWPAATVLAALSFYFGFKYVRQFAELIWSLRVETALIRLRDFVLAIETFLRHPVLGLGYGTFDVDYLGGYDPYSKVLTHDLHNNFLSVLVSSGLFGFLPYMGTIAMALYCFCKASAQAADMKLRITSIALGIGLISALVEFQLYGGLAEKSLWVMLGLATALATITDPTRRAVPTARDLKNS